MVTGEGLSALIIRQRYNRAKRVLKPFFIPFDHYVTFHGLKNIVREGPNLIIANHPGIGRDVAGVIIAYKRKLHFLTAHYLFDKDILLKNHIRPVLGPFFYKLFYPVAVRFSRFLEKTLKEQEMIPINKDYSVTRAEFARNLRSAIEQAKKYLLQGRAVVIFQITYNILKSIGHRTIINKEPSRFHDYIPRFNPTFGKIAWELYRDHNLDIPVTPIAIHGAEGLNPLHRMVLNIGKPLKISTCINQQPGHDPVILFTNYLESRIAELLVESGCQPQSVTGLSNNF